VVIIRRKRIRIMKMIVKGLMLVVVVMVFSAVTLMAAEKTGPRVISKGEVPATISAEQGSIKYVLIRVDLEIAKAMLLTDAISAIGIAGNVMDDPKAFPQNVGGVIAFLDINGNLGFLVDETGLGYVFRSEYKPTGPFLLILKKTKSE
jgi:hypothetical protein